MTLKNMEVLKEILYYQHPSAMKSNKQLLGVILVIGILIPIFLYLYYLLKFGVDVPFLDQWLFVPLLKAYYNHEGWFSMLFEQHNEHRLIFPRLIFLLLAKLTDWNTKIEMFAGWIVCIFNFGLIWLILRQTRIKATWILVPLAWIVFSVGQWQNIIWGWQLQWYMAVFGVLAAVLFLIKTSVSNWYIIPAAISGILATFSLTNGLLIWPMGLLQLWFSKDKPVKKINLILIWLLIGVFIFIAYFMDYTKPSHLPALSASLAEPLKFVQYMLANLGAGLGSGTLIQSIIMGAILIAIFIVTFFLVRSLSRERLRELVPWFVLGLFSIFSSASIAIGRVGRGVGQSLSARYVTIASLLIISSIILCLTLLKESKNNYSKYKNMVVLNIVLFACILIGLFTTIPMAFEMGRQTYLERVKSVAYLNQFEYASDEALSLLFYPDPPFLLREGARFLKVKRLSIFRNFEEFNLSNYKEISPLKEFPIGFIDKLEVINVPVEGESAPSEQVLHIAGWAMDPVTRKIPRAIFILCDGRLLGRAYSGATRPAVAKAFQDDCLMTSGWDFFVPNKEVASGTHKFTARVLLTDRYNYADITKEITIPYIKPAAK